MTFILSLPSPVVSSTMALAASVWDTPQLTF